MAERRSIYKKISLSENLGALSLLAQLLFTWSIAHADDVGVLPRSSKMLRGLVFPLKDEVSSEEVEEAVQEALRANLYIEFEYDGEKYLKIKNFSKHQTLKKTDRSPMTLIHFDKVKSHKENWATIQGIVDECTGASSMRLPLGIQMETEGKGREGKGSKIDQADNDTKTEKSLLPTNASDFIRFFTEATKKIRNIQPIIDGGKDGRLINIRLKELGGDISRLEQMTIWFLTRKKRVKGAGDQWTDEYKYSPSISFMLSANVFNQLLSEEENAAGYMKESLIWVSSIYEQTTMKRGQGATDMASLLANRFKVSS